MNSSIIQIMFQTCKSNRKYLLILLLVIGLSVLVALIPAQLLRLLIDQNLIPKINRNIELLAITYLVVLLSSGFIDFMKGYCLSILGAKLSTDLRSEMLAKTRRLQPLYFKNHSPAESTSRFMSDVDALNSLFQDGVISMVIDALKIIGILISIVYFSWQLGMIAILLIPIIFGLTRFFQARMLKAQVENLNQLANVNQQINESLRNMKMIQIFSKEAYQEKAYCESLVKNYHTKESVNRYDSLYAPIIQIIRALSIIVVFVLAFHDLKVFALSVGQLAASIELISSLLSPIESLGMEISNIQKGISGMKRLDQFFSETEESSKDESLQNTNLFIDGISSIEFHHVCFAYPQKKEVIHDLNLTITPKTRTTFVGRTGAGKSTLFSLILGLYHPSSGSITINGIDVASIPHQQKRKLFGYVEQQFQFIQGTISTQISLNDPKITQEQIVQACQRVGLHESIMAMSSGYETAIVGGDELSQGQKQLLSIARAIVSDPYILLLDEITANLDSTSEAKINTVLSEVMKDRTIFTITHRLSSIMENERIIQLETN